MKQWICLIVNCIPERVEHEDDLDLADKNIFDIVRDLAFEPDPTEEPDYCVWPIDQSYEGGEIHMEYLITVEGSDDRSEMLARAIFASLFGRHLYFGRVEQVIWHGDDLTAPIAVYGSSADLLISSGVMWASPQMN